MPASEILDSYELREAKRELSEAKNLWLCFERGSENNLAKKTADDYWEKVKKAQEKISKERERTIIKNVFSIDTDHYDFKYDYENYIRDNIDFDGDLDKDFDFDYATALKIMSDKEYREVYIAESNDIDIVNVLLAKYISSKCPRDGQRLLDQLVENSVNYFERIIDEDANRIAGELLAEEHVDEDEEYLFDEAV